jgi:hypothetical protein
MQYENPIKLLRMLKGAPLSVLLAVTWSGQAVTNGWLASVTGYTDKTVASALILLKEYDMITNTRTGWMIAKGTQLKLGFSGNSDTFVRLSRNNSDSSSSLIKESVEIYSEEQQEESEKFRINPLFESNLVACLTSKIREPKASILADLPHVTPEYIYAHTQTARLEGNVIGTAIYRIENNWDQPIAPPDPTQKVSYMDEYLRKSDGAEAFKTGEKFK